MPPRKPVPSLLSLSLAGVSLLVRRECLRVANVAVTRFVFDELEAGGEDVAAERVEAAAWEREIYLSEQIDLFKTHVLGHVSAGSQLMELVLAHVLRGVTDAILAKKNEFTPTTSLTRFTREMYAITKFSNLLISPTRIRLDLESIPKMIRSKLYSSLRCFRDLRYLNLGSGSGGWVTEAYADHFHQGLLVLRHLAHLSLKYDCTEAVLAVLADGPCAKTLRVLDIERSRQVRDECVRHLLRCSRLQDINIFQTDLSTQAKADVILGLAELKHLRRGDFLCDVIDHIHAGMPSQLEEWELKIEEFWASEDYYFHSAEQLKLTSQYCPCIRKMLFMFNSSSFGGRLSILADFDQLEDLELWGGAFYTDGVYDLLESVGPRLHRLSLVHTEELDERALALLTVCCPNLHSLGFHNCEFVEKNNNNDGDDDPYGRADRRLQLEATRHIESMSTPWLDLRKVKIVSSCSADYFVQILAQCINVREIFVGMNTAVSDECIRRILRQNSLQHLTSLCVQHCKKVSLAGVELLLDHCSKLRVLKDLSYFEGLHELEVRMCRAQFRENNLDLDTGNDQETSTEILDNVLKQLGIGWRNPSSSAADNGQLLDNSNEWDTVG